MKKIKEMKINDHEVICFEERKAESRDIEELIDISRKCFPEAVRWQIPRILARRRWGKILKSQIADTWVCYLNERVAGYVILIKDNNATIAKHCHYDRHLLGRIIYLLLCPQLIFKKLARKIRVIRNKNIIIPKIQDGEKLQNYTWVDSIGVRPEMRKKGVARKLLNICKNRTLELEKEGIKLSVETKNIAAKNLYQDFGFHCELSKYDTEVYAYKP